MPDAALMAPDWNDVFKYPPDCVRSARDWPAATTELPGTIGSTR